MMFWYLMALFGVGQAETPRSFLQQVYAGYRTPDYSPLERLDATFAPALAAAIREDERLANGEVGYLDGDRLCDCQDFQKLRATIRSVKRPHQRTASAVVDVDLGFDQARHLRIELVRTTAGWRVADILSRDGSGLLRNLKRSNRSR